MAVDDAAPGLGGTAATERMKTFLAELEGKEAGRAGRPITSNPYEPTTAERLQWLTGWIEATTLSGRRRR